MKSRILVVEDSAILLELYETYFRARNLEVSAAGSAEEGWEIFRKRQDEVALVITDGELPKEDGIWLARKIRGISSVPILLVSGSVGFFSDLPGFDCVNEVLQKPFATNDLSRTLRKYLKPPKRRDV